MYSVPLKVTTEAPPVSGKRVRVSWVALSTDSTLVSDANKPSPLTTEASIPTWIPVVDATVIW